VNANGIMKPKYFEQFSDDNIKKLLLSRGKFALLEDVLAKEKAELTDIENQTRDLDFDKPLNETQIKERLDIIAKDVNEFLGVRNVDIPKLEAFTIFDPSGKHILKSYLVGSCWISGAAVATGVLRKVRSYKGRGSKIARLLSRRAVLLGSIASLPGIFFLGKGAIIHKIFLNDAAYIAENQVISYSPRVRRIRMEMFLWHEYTHHLQHILGFHSQKKLSLLSATEGHARGVDEYMSRTYAIRHNNKAYRYNYLAGSVDELQSTYLWLGQKLGLNCRQNLLGDMNADVRVDLSHYGPGHALFSIYSHTQGEEIYRNILHGEFGLDLSSERE